MNLIEQATRRLEELERVGVTVPWDAARVGLEKIATLPGRTGQSVLDPASKSGRADEPHADVQPALRRSPSPQHVVQLDLAHLAENGYLVPAQARSELAEQFRHIKRPLLRSLRERGADERLRNNHLLVTSALPGEGKTFCSINMAMSLAMEVDTAVILVDADVIRPSVFQRLGLNAGEQAPCGLLDYLSGRETDLSRLIAGTNIPKLLLMSTGPATNQSSELLASASMDRLLDQFNAEYPDHVVIFDASPVLLTTESTVLAAKAGQVLMVVEFGNTPKTAVKQACDALRHCQSVSTVLNKCNSPLSGRRYGYYYG